MIMNYRFLYCLILFACLSQAGYSQTIPWRNLFQRQQPQQQILTVEIVPSRITYGNARLSDMIESIEYVPLETTDESLIGRIGFAPSSFDVSDNYILVNCIQQRQIFLFSRDGRFITRVGRQGQGPGEYTMPGDVFLDEKNDQIFVGQLQQGILVYNLRGEFVRYIPREDRRGSLLRFHNDHFFIQNLFHSPFAYEVRDADLQLVAKGVKNELYGLMAAQAFGSPANSYLFNDNVHVRKAMLCDTIFVINNDFSFTPRFVITAGRLTPTRDLLGTSLEQFTRRISGYVNMGRTHVTANKVIFGYRFQNRSHYAYFDKNTERLFHFRTERRIPNDFDGGVNFWPRRQDNLIWYQFFGAYYLIENSGRITPTGGTEAVQNFNRLIEGLDEDDNPVLMIVRLRE